MMDNPAIGMKHILIIDDDQLTALALMSALKADDRNILAVSGGPRALTEMSSKNYDLVFLEIGLVDQSGKIILEEVCRYTPSASVVVMSADILDRVMESAIIDNSHFFLPKPFEVLQVRAMVKKILSETDHSQTGIPGKDERVKERRRWPRSKHSGRAVCIPSHDGTHAGMLKDFCVEVYDVSRGGVGFQTDHPVPPGQRICFQGETAVWEGVVMWSLVFGSRFRAGLEFV